jgi:protein involved in polysaccharide export with SLBB domain
MPIVTLLMGSLNGCTANNKQVKDETHAESMATMATGATGTTGSTASTAYIIQPNDELSIKFFYNPELNEDVVVRPDGKISMQLVDEIQASGKTPEQLDKELTERYSVELKRPAVTVILRSFGGQQIFVGGEVGRPQAITLTPQMTPLQAVINAGGFLDTADKENAIVVRAGANNQPQTYSMNLEQIAEGEIPDTKFQLHAGDVVYIPKTGIAKADVWMDQHVRRFLLFNGFSVNKSFN